MTYEYRCQGCSHYFDVMKPSTEITRQELCEKCGLPGERNFAPSRLYLNGTKVQNAEYNPGLGCIVRNKEHRKELCKIKGVEEIGNEKPEALHKYFDQTRADKREQIWNEVDRGWVGCEG